ncbi:hypothetical protein ABBQ38_002314 [Trebouxia sp. C0009 RCD-2024]
MKPSKGRPRGSNWGDESAVFKCIAIGAAYVAPFYLRGSQARNHPATIKFRMASTVATSLLAWFPLYQQVHKTASPKLLLALLGLRTQGLLQAVVKPTLLTASLFAGPLVQLLLTGKRRREAPDPLQGLRDLMVGPFTEEFCFRACMAPLFLLQGYSYMQTVLLTPLMFGVAHLHHLVELVNFQRVQLTSAVAMVLFQFGYTTVFGWYATHIFLSTGHLAGAVAVHSFCNWMGFPAIETIMHHPRRNILLTAYIGGIMLFSMLLKPSTSPVQNQSRYQDLVAKARVSGR